MKAVGKKKFVVTTDSKDPYPVADHVLNRDFKATAAAQKWVSDITYLKTTRMIVLNGTYRPVWS